MIISMTGFGRSEISRDGVTISVELRSVNNRFLEISARMPRELNARENDMREIIRKTLTRGKIHLNINVERQEDASKAIDVDPEVVKTYKDALELIRKHAKIKETVGLEHLLHFSDEIFGRSNTGTEESDNWELVAECVEGAVREIDQMRRNEGRELARDIRERIKSIDAMVDRAEQLSKDKIPAERQRLRERIAQLFENDEIDEQRLEFEIVMLSDKLDITEECVRYRSHSKYFVEAVKGPEPAGRKLGFLLQEINREVTTIGSKCNDAEIAHMVVRAKEELEKIREQVQNIE
ncbi:MAG: Stress-induced protein [Chlorobi bacterium]|nr:Stress-induced protein [Chlorobiota bacterium]